MKLVIADYGMANLRSVQKAFERIGHPAVVSADPAEAAKADKLVVPGVGAFADAIARLRSSGLDEAIRDHASRDRPFLGICLGLQLLLSQSLEDGEHEGLGVLAGEVVRFDPSAGVKVPHMGWNSLRFPRPSPLFLDVPPSASVYFVHSYHAIPADSTVVSAEADYPTPFVAAVQRGNLFAVQFHPEKSQSVGLRILSNFAELS